MLLCTLLKHGYTRTAYTWTWVHIYTSCLLVVMVSLIVVRLYSVGLAVVCFVSCGFLCLHETQGLCLNKRLWLFWNSFRFRTTSSFHFLWQLSTALTFHLTQSKFSKVSTSYLFPNPEIWAHHQHARAPWTGLTTWSMHAWPSWWFSSWIIVSFILTLTLHIT